jgi:hypothetical protein
MKCSALPLVCVRRLWRAPDRIRWNAVIIVRRRIPGRPFQLEGEDFYTAADRDRLIAADKARCSSCGPSEEERGPDAGLD